jgi:hypothetical protein
MTLRSKRGLLERYHHVHCQDLMPTPVQTPREEAADAKSPVAAAGGGQ